MASLQRLVRPGSSRNTLLQRLAHQKSLSTTIRTSTFHTALAPQFPVAKPAGRLPKRISTQHAIARRATALRAMATSASAPAPSSSPSPTTTADADTATFAKAKSGAPWPVFLAADSPVTPEAAEILRRPLDEDLVEIKPDGMIYLPEIWYRSILFDAFGPAGWFMMPLGPPQVGAKMVTRDWAMFVNGKYVSQATGEGTFFSPEGVPRALEGAKSNALMRCCKDLGVASELWDRRFVRKWKSQRAQEFWVEHQTMKKKAKIWLRKGDPVEYPFKLISAVAPPKA